MPKPNMFIKILEKTLEEYKIKLENNEICKKFSMASLLDSIREISKNFKNEKKDKKNVKLTPYNYFVRNNMSEVMKDSPDMDGAARMKELGKRWGIYKINNPNYKEISEKENGSNTAEPKIIKKTIKKEKENNIKEEDIKVVKKMAIKKKIVKKSEE
jgi:hypothetical protein